MSRTFLCDNPECRSSCELDHRVTDSDVLAELARRGWVTVGVGAVVRHYCPTHHEDAYREPAPAVVGPPQIPKAVD